MKTIAINDFIFSTITGVESIIFYDECHFDVRVKGCLFVDEIVNFYKSQDFTPIEISYDYEKMELVICCILI